MATLAAQLAAAQAKLAEYTAAETEALQAQEIRFTAANGMDRSERIADLSSIRRGIVHWTGVCHSLEARIAGRGTFAGMTYSSANFGNSSNTSE